MQCLITVVLCPVLWWGHTEDGVCDPRLGWAGLAGLNWAGLLCYGQFWRETELCLTVVAGGGWWWLVVAVYAGLRATVWGEEAVTSPHQHQADITEIQR